MKLSDGTVIPSAFRASTMDLSQGAHKVGRFVGLKIGTILAVRYINSNEGLQMSRLQSSGGKAGEAYETVYDVRVDEMLYKPFVCVGCRTLKPFFGPNNYFEVIHESSNLSKGYTPQGMFSEEPGSLAGARCVLMFLEGEASTPVIVGFLNHPARKSKITESDGLQLGFEFNGINVTIDKDGAFTLLASGPLTTPQAISHVPLPQLDIRKDPVNGPLKVIIDKTFNFKLIDVIGQTIDVSHSTPNTGTILFSNGDDLIQIDKTLMGGTITINSSLNLEEDCKNYALNASTRADIKTGALKIGADVSAEIDTKTFTLNSNTSVTIKTAQMKVNCQATFALETKTMSFKGATGELLNILVGIVNGIGNCTPSSPVGPCAPISGSPQWAIQVQGAINNLQGLIG